MFIGGEEVFVIDIDDHDHGAMLYAPLRGYLALITHDAADTLLAREQSGVHDAVVELLQNRPRLDPIEILKAVQDSSTELALALTDDCNLRCLYCHASAGEPNKRRGMTATQVDAILTSYFDQLGHPELVRISFNGGGEPTFAFGLLRHAVAQAKLLASAIGTKCHFSMATNGCYGNAVRQFIVNNFAEVSLSFDGPPHIQNRHRPTAGGGESFDAVFKTARFFCEREFPFALRATVSKYSLPYLPEVIRFFSEHFPNVAIGLEHLSPFGRGAASIDPEVTPPDKADFARALVEALALTEGTQVRLLNSASTEYDVLRPVFCSNVGAPNWGVTTEGKITACARDNAPEVFVFGEYDPIEGCVRIDTKKRDALRSMNVTSYPECAECFSKYNCAGDCPDRRLGDRSDCVSIRSVGAFVLKQKLGLTGHNPAVNALNDSLHVAQRQYL